MKRRAYFKCVVTTALFIFGTSALVIGQGLFSQYNSDDEVLKPLTEYMELQADKSLRDEVKVVINAASILINDSPLTVMDKTTIPPSGDKHDYFTIAPYFWPDSTNKDGLPWLNKDGQVNPMTRGDNVDYDAMKFTFTAINTLSKAAFYTLDQKYGNKAVQYLRAWFIDPATKMNPHLNYAQGVPGSNSGRCFGIIEFGGITNIITSVEMLKYAKFLNNEDENAFKIWVKEYLHWLETSDFGKEQSAKSNNHGTNYDSQIIGLYFYFNRFDEARDRINTITKKRIDSQIKPDGSQPSELRRTKAFSYSVMNLDAFLGLAYAAKKVGVDLWSYHGPESGSLQSAYNFLHPYASNDKKWPYKQIVSMDESKKKLLKMGEFIKMHFN